MLERVRTSGKPTWFDSDKCFIDGRWVEPQSGRRLPLEDPSRGVEIGEIARGEAADIDAAVEAAERALGGEWGKLTANERGRLLMKLAGANTAMMVRLMAMTARPISSAASIAA